VQEAAMSIRLMCWNIRHGGGARVERIYSAIRAHRAEIVVLTEFRDNSPGRFLRESLASGGWVHQASSAPPPRANGVLIASRDAFVSHEQGDDVPPDRHRWVTVQFENFGLTGTYFPSLHAKVPHWEYMLRVAARNSGGRHIVFGDVNTGKNYIDEARSVFHYGDYIDRMAALGWPEAWRYLHPTGRQYSWYSHKKNGFRIDHAYVSPALVPNLRQARYSHRGRKEGISDHSALVVELAF
jgi:exodeoxyribonuclease-3